MKISLKQIKSVIREEIDRRRAVLSELQFSDPGTSRSPDPDASQEKWDKPEWTTPASKKFTPQSEDAEIEDTRIQKLTQGISQTGGELIQASRDEYLFKFVTSTAAGEAAHLLQHHFKKTNWKGMKAYATGDMLYLKCKASM